MFYNCFCIFRLIKKVTEEAKEKGEEIPPLAGSDGKPVEIRPLNFGDFKAALEQVSFLFP